MSDDPRRRLDDLEWKLERYFEWLEGSVKQRDHFNLRATWGLIKGLSGIVAYVAANYVAGYWLGRDTWAGGIVGGIGGIIAYGIAAVLQDRGEQGDLEKLQPLPKWADME